MAASGTRTYDPKQIIITFGGVPISGYADGTFIKVSPAGDRFTRKVGADGEVARSRSNNDCHNVEITLMQTSPGNAALSAVLAEDRFFNTGIRPLQIADINGSVLDFWPDAWIKADPDQEYSKEVGDRTWMLETGQVGELFIVGKLFPG